MPEHVHGCLNCRPDMVPAFDRADPRYHAYPKCGSTLAVTVNGKDAGYTNGAFEGPEGWALLCAEGTLNADLVHPCPTCKDGLPKDAEGFTIGEWPLCVTPVFGRVDVIHACPSEIAARAERLAAALKPLVPESVYLRAMYGEKAG